MTERQSPDSFYVAELTYDTDVWMPSHVHEDVSTVAFCLNGTIQEFRDGRVFTVGASALSVMPMGVAHANRFPKGTRTFLLLLRAAWFERYPPLKAGLDQPMHCHGGTPAWIAERMYREYGRRDSLTPMVLEGMLLELLAEMMRGAAHRTEPSAPRWLRQVEDLLHARFAEEIPMDALAATAHVHPAHLMRTFRRFHRCTVGEYVRRLRVEHACRLLSATDTPLSQIARAAGFSDQSHFSHAFKRAMGVTPAAFRNAAPRASRTQQMLL